MKNLNRLVQKERGTMGWQVRIQKNGKLHNRFFADQLWGGKWFARRAAVEYLDRLSKRLGVGKYLKPKLSGIALALALGFSALQLIIPDRAECADCLPTFCGQSAECPGDCVCAVPIGKATGVCVGSR